MIEILQASLQTLIQIFEAGIAITALSLFIRALSFNLSDRVSRSFAIMLACVVTVFSGESISSAGLSPEWMEFWYKFQWLGIVVFPAAVLNFSDALLATTGEPSRGRRIKLVWLGYIISIGFVVALAQSKLVGSINLDREVFPHLERTPISTGFTFYYLLATALASWIIWRSYSRTRLTISRKRLRNIFIGVISLAIGLYPYMQFGSGFAEENRWLFLGLVVIGNLFVFIILVTLASATAYFGVSWPDRIIKSRLFKWMLRVPVTIFIVLSFMTFAHRVGLLFNTPYSVAIPIFTVAVVLFTEHLITLVYPLWERYFFHGGDRQNLQLLQSVEESLITTKDLEQFLQSVLASVCDRFQVSTAFVAALGEQGMERVVQVGDLEALKKTGLDAALVEKVKSDEGEMSQDLFAWDEFWLYPLHSENPGKDELVGLLGVLRTDEQVMDEELGEALVVLGARATLALENRRLQTEVFQALERLNPSADLIQRLRAASRYDQTEILSDVEDSTLAGQLIKWVKDALSHYWGGPKLTESPLMRLEIVKKALTDHKGNPVNALRAILKEGIERVRPEGERRFTADWILYNILDMKFMEGRKVKDIALRLAMSEADLYRKQRVAIEAVAGAILDMERQLRSS
ncbi:MAG: hypothetical protein N2D54_07015 [Chloroflexota bacterium]